MDYEVLPDGNLKLTADETDRSDLGDEIKRGGYYQGESYIAEAFHESLAFIAPEAIGALTDAPILTDDADYSDAQMAKFVGPAPYPDAKVWWFPDYMVRDPWEELAAQGYVVFTKAESESA